MISRNNFLKQEKTLKKHRKKISFQEIRALFHLHVNEAAEKLKISPTQLKRLCRENNVPRWPARKV